MIVEISTSIAGVALWLQCLARQNVLDCHDRPELAADLVRRVEKRADLQRYQREDPDCWTSFAVYYDRLAERKAKGDPSDVIVGDCEDFMAMLVAYQAMKAGRAWACATQPNGSHTAHAYGREDDGGRPGRVIDPCVWYGMKAPPAGFYDDPEADTVCYPVERIR